MTGGSRVDISDLLRRLFLPPLSPQIFIRHAVRTVLIQIKAIAQLIKGRDIHLAHAILNRETNLMRILRPLHRALSQTFR
ncbi:hypothetical protein X737_39815 [Mesorhizobium sp. L48C026A00]|nr:hypothetical protein X737_39815 [Mesorhizobium sp. L48C026A00]